MVVLDLLVFATALNTIRRDLGASIGQLEWTVNAYTLALRRLEESYGPRAALDLPGQRAPGQALPAGRVPAPQEAMANR